MRIDCGRHLAPLALGSAPDARRAEAFRPITPRGELAPDEKATIELFERSRDSVGWSTIAAMAQAILLNCHRQALIALHRNSPMHPDRGAIPAQVA